MSHLASQRLKPRASRLRHVVVLGSLMALSAAGTDAYLPAFPTMADALGTGEDRIQLTLVSYFLALAVGQLLYGPLSDRVGRKRPLYVGLVIFTLASVACAFATSVEALIVIRFIQGLGACAGMVLSLATVRDLHSGVSAARLLSLMMLVLGISPLLAPLTGSALIQFFPWTSVFWMLAILGAGCLLLVYRFLEETHPAEKRLKAGLGQVFGTYGLLFRDRRFVTLVCMMTAGQAGFFAYLVGAPFVFLTLHGVAPTTFSVLFGLFGMCLIMAAQMNARLLLTFGGPRVLVTGTFVYAASGGALLLAALLGADTLLATVLFLMVSVAITGVIMPTGSVLALEPFPRIAGAASSLIGATRFIGGAMGGVLVTVFFDGTVRPLATLIVGGGLVALLLARAVLRGESARAGLSALEPSKVEPAAPL